MTNTQIIKVVLLMIAAFPCFAQSGIVTDGMISDSIKKTKPFQMTFVYPIGTDTKESAVTNYNVSLNLLDGITGNINGFELSGLYNIKKGNIKGAKVTGLFDITEGDVKGVQVTGLFNIINGEVRGLQVGGIFNMVEGGTKGVQIAGVFNNIEKGGMHVQVAGVLNRSNGNTKVQLAGLMNHSQHSSTNTQIAGLLNCADTVSFQLSGLVNKTHKGGFQLGIINIRDTDDGLMLGLINIAKENGVFEAEVAGSEFLNTSIALRTGVRRLYSILSFGYNFSDPFFGYGAGLGTTLALNDRWGINIEGTHIFLADKNFNSKKYNALIQLKPLVYYNITDRFKIFAGPSASLYVANNKNGENDLQISTPSTIFSRDGNTALKGWIGATMGVRLNLF